MESDRVICTPSDGTNDGGQRMRSIQGRTSGPTRRSTKGQWTPEEDEILRKAVQRFKGKNWKKIEFVSAEVRLMISAVRRKKDSAECFKDRTDVQCLHRWQKVLNPELVKGPWSKEEDEVIIELVNKYGPKKWSTIAQHLPGRIGKQCRERWHNHLNPAINKEAWTQEEEIALIRAHQIYGNRWAELTKFLPGRTDNAIKNHWNSSVKKKLDSYLASGLLEQFQGLPLVAHQNQMMASSSSRIQSSGDDSGPKGAIEAEEISECSQESTVAGGYPSAGALVMHTKDQPLLKEESLQGKERISSPVPYSEQYYTSLDDVTFSIPEIPCEVGCSSKYSEENFVHDAGPVANRDCQFHLPDLPNLSSLKLGHQSSGLSTHFMGSHDSQAVVNIPYQNSKELGGPIFTAGSGKPDYMLISDDECCRALFTEAMKDGCFSLENFTQGLNIADSGGFSEFALSQSLNIETPESVKALPSQSHCPSKPDVSGNFCSQSHVSARGPLTVDDGAFAYGMDSNQSNRHLYGTPEKDAHNGFINTNEPADSPCNNGSSRKGLKVPSYISKDSLKLVPVNSFGSGSDVMLTSPRVNVMSKALTEQQEIGSQTPGSLCYEPPRFPGLDVPFFSCDLIQSGGDMQQEYSPLGIRQLMMSSMNCISPFRLWDSPSGDRSPDAVLKNAAKTFTGTPSILKKRNRDLLTPLSDRKNDKKLEIDMTSGLTQDFLRLDVMFDECVAPKASLLSSPSNQKNCGSFVEDKENVGSAFDGNQDKNDQLDDGAPENVCDVSKSQVDLKPKTVDGDSKTEAATENVEQAAVLIEHNMNDLLFSPDQGGIKADKALRSVALTPKYQHRRSSGALSNLGIASPGNPCSPAICKKNAESNSGAVNSAESIPSSAPLSNTVANVGNDAVESYSIFGGTPFRRSIESPSAWKSPWFINSFVPGPRVDTEITIEDIGVFMSPGVDRSYDAIGLMKQLSEHSAGAYADAMEVLGNETSETTVGERISNHQNDEKQNDCVAKNQQENPQLAANVLMERRVLDFSECGTPGKGTENVKTSSGISFSSPSSYLLKGCR